MYNKQLSKDIKDTINKESLKINKQFSSNIIKGFLEVFKSNSLEINININTSKLYLPAKHIYSYMFYISVRICSKFDKSYVKYSDLKFNDFIKIMKTIDISANLYIIFSTLFTSIISGSSELIIKSINKLINKSNYIKNILINMISVLLFGIIKLTKSSEFNEIDNLFSSVKNLISSMSSNNIALLSYTLFIAPYIEETFKSFCIHDTKLGIDEIIITNILEESIKKYLMKSNEMINGLLEELQQASITPYTVPIKSIKDIIARLMLLLTTTTTLKIGKKYNKTTLPLVINIITHMLYNSYMLSKTITNLK